MAAHKAWKQEGPLGSAKWQVLIHPAEISVRLEAPHDDPEGFAISAQPASERELRDFARALDRAAAAMEAARLET